MAPDGNFNQFDIDAQPFDPVKFFAGTFQAQGMFVDRFGQVQKRFLIDISCEAEDKQTTLHEKFTYDDGYEKYSHKKTFEGVINNLERRYLETDSDWKREEIAQYQSDTKCERCNGHRLKR